MTHKAQLTQFEYRFVRPSLYPSGTSFEAMEGHYIRATDMLSAAAELQKQFPGEALVIHTSRTIASVDAGRQPKLSDLIKEINHIRKK